MAEIRKPLHPPITDFPVALWTLSIVFDLLSFKLGNPLVHAAYYNLALGGLFAVAAAVTGILDYARLTVGTPPKRLGIVHAAFQAGATFVMAVNLWFRFWELGRDRVPVPGLILSALALGLLTAGTRLGSRLVFEHGANVRAVAGEERVRRRVPARP